MVKRRRRNLSNPTIKRIVKQQTGPKRKTSTYKNKSRQNAGPSGGLYLFLGLLVIAGATVLAYNKVPEFKLLVQSAIASQPARNQRGTASKPAPVLTATPSGTNAVETHSGESREEVTEPALQPVARRIQVEVLNGCGVDGLAEKLTGYLRGKNIDVVSRSNYKHFEVKKTRLLDRIGNVKRSGRVAEVLGLPPERVSVQKDNNLQLDVTIILGMDYKQLKGLSE